jgi:biopolymer transport protein ExbB
MPFRNHFLKPFFTGGPMGQRSFTAKFFTALLLCAFAIAALKPSAARADSWWNSDWSARKTITIDTSATGAGITDPIGTIPVLIRLDVSNFTFDSANPDGSDLRFIASDDKTPLAYHIEKYDHLLGQAFIWVNVPNVTPNAQSAIYLYYGNPKATTPADDAKGTYDANMMLVYHFGEHNTPIRDWTGHGNTSLNQGTPDDYGLIGPGERLDGQTTIQIPGSPPLAWTAGQPMTFSIWFNETNLQPAAVLYSRTDGTNTVQIGVDNGVPFVAITTAAGTQRSSGGTPITAATWHHLTMVTGASITLYVDGVQYGELPASLPALTAIAYLGGDATTGTAPAIAPAAPATPPPAAPAPAATPAPAAATPSPATPAPAAAAPTTGFIGSIDELEIANTARPVGYIKFDAYGQGNNPLAGRLVAYGTEQKPPSFFSGPIFVILTSVTPDGWAVIGILIVMAIVSWVVMADKAALVNRVGKANAKFIEQYESQNGDLIIAAPKKGKKTGLESSPLHEIYQTGVAEIGKRVSSGQAERGLSAQAMAAIRAALDGVVARQTQKLNRSMVLLTIAISGGPFLGLLGTVVGVMLTFATIAAAGDVNVNAIAPGISAALVATVAGLAVAIPALFGYNYLNSRISAATTDMRVFVDEFETRMAERYAPGTIPQRAAE